MGPMYGTRLRDIRTPGSAGRSVIGTLLLPILLGIVGATAPNLSAQDSVEPRLHADPTSAPTGLSTEETSDTDRIARADPAPATILFGTDHTAGMPKDPVPEDLVPKDSTGRKTPGQIVPVGKGSVKITPGKRYDRGGLHRLFFGDLWRDLWGTEIEVPYLDLERTAGGLTPTEMGGGRQTTSLRFRGANNHEYRFRSVDKDFSEILPNPLHETFVDHVVQDLVSAQNPVGALVADPLLDAAEVLHSRPTLFVMPDDPRLGEFREQFAGMLGMLEEHPDEMEGDVPGFMGYEKVVGYEEFYEELREDNDNHVDHIDYLKARLVDMVIGDWGRHRDQYRWARTTVGSENYWHPVPRDRDMAFTRYDGIIPALGEIISSEVEGFGEDYPDIENLTLTGKALDRRFLVPISRGQWDSTTRLVMARLTDAVIDNAVHRMPKELFEKEGPSLMEALRSRRDRLAEASEELFRLTHRQADLWGSNEDEYVEIDRIDDDRVTVSFYRRDKETGEKKGSPYLQHTFHRDETDEVRLIMLDGNDRAVVRGTVGSSITVKVDGGKGSDEFVDDSEVKGYFWFTPIPDAETSTYFYDSDEDSKFKLGNGTRIDHHHHDAWREDSVAYYPFYRDEGDNWLIAPWLGYDSEDGFYGGIRPTVFGYGFRQEPYAWEQSIGLGYGLGSRAFIAEYNGDFRTFVPNARVLINATASEREMAHFFGFGNETELNTQLAEQGFYEIGERHLSFTTDVSVPETSIYRLYMGLQATYTRTRLDESPILAELRPYGVDPTALVAARTGFILDTRNRTRAPSSGVFITLTGEYFPQLLDNRQDFAKGMIDARTYLTADVPLPTTLALRGVAQTVVGDIYPYFESVYLGGSRLLRGYDRERFAGDLALSGNVELRLTLFKYKLITRNTFGLIAFADAGRVYRDGEVSDVWHHSYGGGVAFSFANPNYVVALMTAQPKEGESRLYVRLGYSF